MSYVGADPRSVLGAWHEIVGWQESGRPGPLHHGPYGSRHRDHRWHGHHHGWGWGHQPGWGHHHHHHHGFPGFQYAYGVPGGEYALPVAPVAAEYPQQIFQQPAYPAQVYPAQVYPAQVYPAQVYPQPGPALGLPHGPQLVERAAPTRADRITLPMSSGVPIVPNLSAQITSRPQSVAFRPERIIVGGAPSTWIINDIKVGNRSQFAQSGDVPGEMFAATTIDSYVSMETVQTSMDFVMVVTYVGPNEAGAPFVCGVLGTAAV